MKHLWIVVVALAACKGDPTDTDSDPPEVVVTFADANAVFAAKCGNCHTTERFGDHNIGGADLATAFTDSQQDSYFVNGGTKGESSLVRILDGSMPDSAGCTGDPSADSGNTACLNQDEIDIIQAWVDGGQLEN